MSNTMRMYRGDTGHFRFTCVDADGVALDLTNGSAIFTLKASVDDVG